MPKISVIITTKNSESSLKTLLDSLKAQTYKDFEVIVVDNSSTDKTVSISKKYTKNVFTKGPERSAQRNLGAKKAKGKYLLFLDSDMELTSGVLKDAISTITQSKKKFLVIPEKTVGEGIFARVRAFEREMYMGDLSIEVARFFDAKVFQEFNGYDEKLTGPEDYDLPYRISKKYDVDRSNEYILHHEENVTLARLLKRKYYYAGEGAKYASKHPELIKTQGNLLFRKAYITHWRNFVKNPFIGILFIVVRILEATAAVVGYINAVGMVSFIKSLINLFK